MISSGNRNAPVKPDGSYELASVPASLGIIGGRVACSDGTLGQTDYVFTVPIDGTVISMGPVRFGDWSPVPIATYLEAATDRLTTNESAQLSLTAINPDGSEFDISSRSDGTVYQTSNSLLGNISEDGLVTVTAQFEPDASARLVASSTHEGGLSSTFQFEIGPRGSLSGTVFYPDGLTAFEAVLVSVTRLQPQETIGVAVTDVDGRFIFPDLSAGTFRVTAADTVSGDQSIATASITSEGQVVDIALIMNGQGQVNVSVVDVTGNPVEDTEVVLTTMGTFYDVVTGRTDEFGVFRFTEVSAGDFSVSTRDPLTGLLGTQLGELSDGDVVDVTLTLQDAGSITGQVYDVGGLNTLEGIQVRLISRQKGLISQTISEPDGAFLFDAVPKMDGPFILDAFTEGRLRARIPDNIFLQDQSLIEQDIVLTSVGVVSGFVKDNQNNFYPNSRVTMQSLNGLNISFDAIADENGYFVLPGVPLGDFRLTAVSPQGRIGSAQGTIEADTDLVDLDVFMVTNNLVGTVFERDGFTPVSAGVTVYLAPTSLGTVFSYEDNLDVESTVTDSQGNFAFQITVADDYYVQAEAGLNRGRTRTVIVNLNPSQPLEADVVFLAKGTVSGVITDALGNTIEGAFVRVRTAGAFNVDRFALTDSDGFYSINGVFAGNLTAVGWDEVSQTSGVRFQRLDFEGEQVTINISLAASGTVEGRVLNVDGSIVNEPIKLTVTSNLFEFSETIIPDGSFYQVNLVPLGDVRVIAEIISSGNKGSKTTRIDFLNEVKVLDVSMVGLGELRVQLIDEFGTAVTNAKITVSTGIPFETSQELISDGLGEAVFSRVFAGDFLVTANKAMNFGSLTGSQFGTLLPNETLDVTIEMETVSVGQINGTVFLSDGVTPVDEGWVVRMLPEPFQDAYVTITDANGYYEFPQVNEGVYSVTALGFYGLDECPSRDRVRGIVSNATISFQDQVVNANIQFIGQGQVFGKVLNPDLEPAQNLSVTLTSADPIFGPSFACGNQINYLTSTDENGDYSFNDIPPGIFSIRARDVINNLSAEDADQVRFDTDQVEVNMTLVDNVVSMPFNFYDANGFLFDINGDGSVAEGTLDVFAAPIPDTAGMNLEVLFEGVPVPFTNGDGSIGNLRSDRQQVEIDEVMNLGLLVKRQVYVPRSGYFARYLEVLSNPTDSPITVGLRVTSHHKEDNSNARVVDSSNGDQVLSVISANPDRWVVVDDQIDTDPFESNDSVPATGHLFDGNNGQLSASVATYELIGQTGKLTYQWDDITIEPGQELSLMHFVLNQTSRNAARIAANRLLSLPPEAIDDLNSVERESILNFIVPEQSLVETLPNLSAGQISGTVYSGDGFTVVPETHVNFKSLHPLFERVRVLISDSQGGFEFQSTLNGTLENYVIPVYDFTLQGEYFKTFAVTTITSGEFAPDTVTVIKDLVFSGFGDIQGNVLRHNGAFVLGANVRLCTIDDRVFCVAGPPNPANSAVSAADGGYELLVNPLGIKYLFADKSHPQSFGIGRSLRGRAELTVFENTTELVDVVMEPTGSISGFVRLGDGTPVTDAAVKLSFNEGQIPYVGRATTTDTSGFYRLFDVPVGSHNLVAEDPISGARGSSEVDVLVDQDLNQDITLESSTLVNITIEYERGEPANNALVRTTVSSQNVTEYSDSNGLVQFQLPVGTHGFIARHPDNILGSSALTAYFDVVVSQGNDVLDVTINLPASGEVFGTIVRPDGTTLAGGFPYKVKQITGPSINDKVDFTDILGDYRVPGLPPGIYVITAYDEVQERFADAEFVITNDGEELLLDLTLLDETIPLPANLQDSNRFNFDIDQDGSIRSGAQAFDNASSLLIDGVAFSGATSAKLEAGNKQFAITQDTPMSGLNVSRKVYVPRGGYFARFLEVLENNTASDITVDVNLNSVYLRALVVDTSDGDNVLTDADQWLLIDDEDDEDYALNRIQVPVTAHVYMGDDTLLPTPTVDVVSTSQQTEVNQYWDQLTISAGQSVTLMHMMVQQINQAGASFAVNRIIGLPPEILNDLNTSELLSIKNFNVPVDGVSQLPSLPPLTGQVSGLVFEGDLSTVVSGAKITVQSTHPLFNRIWGIESRCGAVGTEVLSLVSSSTGNYALQAQLTDTNAIAIPQGYDLRVVAHEDINCSKESNQGHPLTGVPSRASTLEASGTQDVIFDTAIVTGSVLGPFDYSVTDGFVYRSVDLSPRITGFDNQVRINSDGSFVFPGLPTGSLDLIFDNTHPDAISSDVDILRGINPDIQVSTGDVLVANISMQPTGVLQGVVTQSDGSPSTDGVLQLIGPAEDQTYNQCETGCVPETLVGNIGKKQVGREVPTDGLGRYGFAAVPSGIYELIVTDSVVGGTVTTQVVISENQTQIENILLNPTASIRVTVVDQEAGNLPIGNARLVIKDVNDPTFEQIIQSDLSGRALFSNLPPSSYEVMVEINNEYESTFSAEINATQNGQLIEKTVSFATSQHAVGDFNSGQDIHSYEIGVISGDELSLGIRSSNFCRKIVNVYDVNDTLIATGYGRDRDQANTANRLDLIDVTDSGRYTISVLPVGSGCYSGDYRLSAAVDGLSVPVENIQLSGLVDLLVTVVNQDTGNSLIPGAQLRMTDPDDPTFYLALQTDSAGTALIANLPPSIYELSTEYTDDILNQNFIIVFVIEITELQNGQVIEKTVSFASSNHVIDTFNYGQAIHLYEIDVTSGDSLSLGVSNSSSCTVRTRVYDSNQFLLSTSLDLIEVNDTGRYTVSLSPNSSGCFIGEYRLSAAVNGSTVFVENVQQAGSVNGAVYDTDGATPIINQPVRLETLDIGPKYKKQVNTDNNGMYAFTDVPLGNFRVTYVPNNIQETGFISTQGEQVTIDLVLELITTMNIRVLNEDLTPVNAVARLEISAPGQSTFRPNTNSLGRYTYTHTGTEAVSISVTSPFDSQLKAIELVEPNGGDMDVDLVLVPAIVQGYVYELDGSTPAPSSNVYAYFANGGSYIGQTITDSQGFYIFNSLPADASIELRAEDPVNGVFSFVDILADAQNAVNQDIQLNGRGQVFGRITGFGDVPASELQINARYVTNVSTGQSRNVYGTTQADGNYVFEGLPIGQPITITYDEYRNYNSLYGFDEVDLVNDGDSVVLDLTIPGSSVSITLTAADGSSVGDQCSLSMITEIFDLGDGGPEYFADQQSCDDVFNVIGIPPNQRVDVKIDNRDSFRKVYANSWQVDFDQLLQESVILSVITGEVTYFDDTVVADARLRTDDDFGARSDGSGLYRMLGVKQGPFNVTADDPSTGLSGQASSEMFDELVAQVLDIKLEESGSVSGVVYDIVGQPMSGVRVFALSTNDNRALDENSDVNGSYQFPHIPIGEVVLSAADDPTKNITESSTTLTADGDVKVVDLQFQPTGSITGFLNDQNGVPVDSGCVELNHTSSSEAHNRANYSTTSDSNGEYLFDAVAPGQILVHGAINSCFSGGVLSALEPEQIVTATATDLDLQIGNAQNLSLSLNDGGVGFKLLVSRVGSVVPINNTSTGIYSNRPFTSSLNLSVNQYELNSQKAAFEELSNQQLLIGSTTTPTLSFSRQVYSDIGGDFARLADKVTNIGLDPVEVKVQLSGRYGNLEIDFNGGNFEPNILLNTDPVSNSNKYAIHQYNGTQTSDPALTGYVFADDNLLIPVTPDFQAARPGFSWSWTHTIQPGDSAIFVSYLVYSEPDDSATVNNIISELIGGTHTNMFEGMSAQDLSDVVNFATN